MRVCDRSTLQALPGNSCVAIAIFCASVPDYGRARAKVIWTRPRSRLSRVVGVYASTTRRRIPTRSLTDWTQEALPSLVFITSSPPDLADPRFGLPHSAVALSRASATVGDSAAPSEAPIRLQLDPAGINPPAVLLPFDQLFEHRAHAALHAWRRITGRPTGLNPAALSRPRRDRLLLAVRALDGRLAGASYREIARALFTNSAIDIAGDAWRTHDLRSRTIRLVGLGRGMMQGGYRRLLLHPYRRALPQRPRG